MTRAEAIQQAREALAAYRANSTRHYIDEAMEDLLAALAAEASEPVAWGMTTVKGGSIIMDCISPEEHAKYEGAYTVPLYLAPPAAVMKERLDKIRDALLAPPAARSSTVPAELLAAAEAVVARWDSPLWKDQPHTGELIHRLRNALAEQAPPAAVPALEVFRIAGGDTECRPQPTAEEALDCLRDLRKCYDEALSVLDTAPPAAVPDREAVARGMYEAEMRRRGLETCWGTNLVIKSGWYGVADDAIAAMLAAAQATKGVE